MPKRRNSFNIEFFGTSELLNKIEAAGENVEKAVTKAVARSMVEPVKDMGQFIKKHHYSGLTERSFGETPFDWKNGKLEYAVGYNMKKGGIAALFLDVGTPSQKPYFFIHNAMQRNLTKIRDTQQEALAEIFRGLM